MYYGHFIPHKRPEGAGEKYIVNQKAKIRQQIKNSLAGKKLQQAGAPETAASAPEGELPQDPKAAEHQKEYLRRLQKTQALDAAAKARREKARKDPPNKNRQKQQKQQQQAPVDKAATPPSEVTSDASKNQASSGRKAARASSDLSAAQASSGASAAQPPSDAISAEASLHATPAERSSDASMTEASSDSAKSTLDPVQASPHAQTAFPPASAPASALPAPQEAAGSSAPSSSDWRLQQRQWKAFQTPRAMPASAGIDLLQSPSSPPPPSQQNRKPGFQGRGPGRPHTPYAPFAPPPPQPKEELEPELSPEEQQQQQEAMETAVRCVALQPTLCPVRIENTIASLVLLGAPIGFHMAAAVRLVTLRALCQTLSRSSTETLAASASTSGMGFSCP